MKSCRNCDTALLYNADFCHACGQKYTNGKHPVWTVITEFVDAVFSFEARSVKTVVGLFFPARLTKEYFSGRQTQYMHPSRIFLLTAGIFLAVFGYQANKVVSKKADEVSNSIQNFLVKQAVIQEIDSVYTNFKTTGALGLDTSKVDSLITQINKTIGDSTVFDGALSLNGAMTIKDSTGKRLNIPFSELADGNVDRIMKKYKGENDYWSRTILSQMIRLIKDPNSFFRQVLGSMIWVIFSLMPAIALVLKLLYIRQKRFFVEHLLFSFHFHAFAFLGLAISIGFFPKSFAIIGSTIGIILIYLFIAIKKYYGQSFLKSLFKWWLLLGGYTLIFLLYFTFWLVISMITF